MDQTASFEKSTGWREAVAPYTRPDLWRSIWQIINSVVPYLVCWVLAYRSLGGPFWVTGGFMLLAAGFQVRIFIIFHDCGHGSFFRSRRANRIVGFFTGVITLTPFDHWAYFHARHHATSSDLDRRGDGDVWTATVREYLAFPTWKKIYYRVYRHPLMLFLIGPFYLFVVKYRFSGQKAKKKERQSVLWTNLSLLAITLGMSVWIGFGNFIAIELPILMIGGAGGIWLFYIQHQFEGTYWEHNDEWDYVTAALKGSSFYKLPKILQWFSGNIGFHHIHHLSPRIPNYYLEDCHTSTPDFQKIEPVTIWSSLKAIKFRLWDEEQNRLISFGELKKRQSAA